MTTKRLLITNQTPTYKLANPCYIRLSAPLKNKKTIKKLKNASWGKFSILT